MSLGDVKRLTCQLVGAIYKNNKNGNHYMVFDVGLNTTNAQDGQILISYKRTDYCNAMIGVTFHREYSEFIKKFTKI